MLITYFALQDYEYFNFSYFWLPELFKLSAINRYHVYPAFIFLVVL